MEIGSLPLAPLRSPGNDTSREPVQRATRDPGEGGSSSQNSSFVLDDRALRARLAARELEADQFNLQPDVSRQTRIALDTYVSIQNDRGGDDALGELLGLDISV